MTPLPFSLEKPKPPRALESAKAALLVGLGLYFAWNIVTGNLDNYINLRFAWLSYLAAALFLMIGLYSAFTLLRGASSTRAHSGRTPLSWGQIAIVSVPLVFGTLIPSRPLGADAISAGGLSSLGGVAAANTSEFSITPLDRNVLDWLRAFNSAVDPAAINGQPADVIGFVYTEPTFEPGQFMAARFTISCCVADASALGLPVQWADAAALPQGGWVRVRGTMQVGTFEGDSLPMLIAESVEAVEQPRNAYLYP